MKAGYGYFLIKNFVGTNAGDEKKSQILEFSRLRRGQLSSTHCMVYAGISNIQSTQCNLLIDRKHSNLVFIHHKRSDDAFKTSRTLIYNFPARSVKSEPPRQTPIHKPVRTTTATTCINQKLVMKISSQDSYCFCLFLCFSPRTIYSTLSAITFVY